MTLRPCHSHWTTVLPIVKVRFFFCLFLRHLFALQSPALRLSQITQEAI